MGVSVSLCVYGHWHASPVHTPHTRPHAPAMYTRTHAHAHTHTNIHMHTGAARPTDLMPLRAKKKKHRLSAATLAGV